MAVFTPSTSTLQTIITKVRRLTRSPSPQELTDQQIVDYVNTFVLYDLPEQLRLFNFRETLTFYTEPNVDTYSTVDAPTTSPLYNFKNRYITVHPPIYVAGYEALYTQDRAQFFNIFPQIRFIQSIGTAGDGVTTTFSGTFNNTPVLQNYVLINSVDANNEGLGVKDIPSDPFNGTGTLVTVDTGVAAGTINYLTGAFTVTFPTAPKSGAQINYQAFAYNASRPTAMLYFDDKFTMRPVPDQVYAVELEVNVQPSELLDSNTNPALNEMYQYISYGASKKVFEDRQDLDSVQLIMPEFKQQERFVLRRTIEQQVNMRTQTIYTEINNLRYGWNGWNYGNGPF